MGRAMPEVQLSQSVLEEVALAKSVEEAVASLAPAQQPDAADAERAEVVERVLAEFDRATAGVAPPAAPPMPQLVQQVPLPIVFLDTLEVTQEVQDLAHSVPLVSSPTRQISKTPADRWLTVLHPMIRLSPAAVRMVA